MLIEYDMSEIPRSSGVKRANKSREWITTAIEISNVYSASSNDTQLSLYNWL